jgi:hypothetical protein
MEKELPHQLFCSVECEKVNARFLANLRKIRWAELKNIDSEIYLQSATLLGESPNVKIISPAKNLNFELGSLGIYKYPDAVPNAFVTIGCPICAVSSTGAQNSEILISLQ